MSLVDPSCDALARAYLHRTRRHPPGARQVRDPMFQRTGSSFDLKNIREYDPSDDPRRVDWRLEARSGRLYVKEYFEEERDGVIVLADVSSSLEPAGSTNEGAGLAEVVAASVAWLLTALGEPVHLQAFAARPLARAARARGRFGKTELGTFFSTLPDDSRDGTDIMTAVLAARRESRYRRIVIVSDFLDPAFAAARLPFAKPFLLRLHRPLGDLVAPGGEVEVEDPESGRRLILPWDEATRALHGERSAALAAALLRGSRAPCFLAEIRGAAEIGGALASFLEAFHA